MADTGIYTRDQIDSMLQVSDRAVERGIIALFKLQTQDEQRRADTVHHNDVGFNSCNARAGTRFARWLLGLDDRNVQKHEPKSLNHDLAGRVFRRYVGSHGSVIARARAITLKHSRQLTAIANGKLSVDQTNTAGR